MVTSGGGGVVLTNDPTLEQRIRHLATTARSSHKWEFVHDEIGYNFRMPALNASLLSPQLDRLQFIIEKKRSLAEEYQANFADFEGGYILKKLERSDPNFWLNCLVLNDEALHYKNHILEQLHQVVFWQGPFGYLTQSVALSRGAEIQSRSNHSSLSSTDYSALVAVPGESLDRWLSLCYF